VAEPYQCRGSPHLSISPFGGFCFSSLLLGRSNITMATYLWHELEAAFDAANDLDDSGSFNETAAAMLAVIQQWLYDEGFDEAADALEEEILHAEEQD